MQLTGKTIFITGAASGLGRQLALQLAQAGCHLLLVDRDGAQLEDLRAQLGQTAQSFVCDLSHSAERQALITALCSMSMRINVLIHCAGIGSHSPLDRLTPEEVNRVLQVNTLAPLELTAGLLPLLSKDEPGGLVTIGSVAGELVTPSMSLYSASKAALHAFSRATAIEMAANGHFSLLVILGALKNTRFAASIRHPSTRQPGWYRRLDADPKIVAAKIVQAMVQERTSLVYPGWYNLVFVLSRACAPITRAISQRVYHQHR